MLKHSGRLHDHCFQARVSIKLAKIQRGSRILMSASVDLAFNFEILKFSITIDKITMLLVWYHTRHSAKNKHQ